MLNVNKQVTKVNVSLPLNKMQQDILTFLRLLKKN